ncbi:MAG: glycosyl transferase family 2 [Pseudonocardiales bacterium]|jgi:lipopolysaccharide biosynthesis protein|nr:glycosyl transferase family 2 [Pseudonocardiales bacterium]
MRRITIAGVRRRASRARAVLLYQKAALVAWNRRRGPHLPVDFQDWVERRLDRAAAGFPDVWRVQLTSFATPSRVGVLVHAFYRELVPELIAELAAIPVEFDLIVTNATGEPLHIDTSALKRLRNTLVLDVANHGRDILPMVQVVNAGLLDPYELVLKLHTKRSPWRSEHETLGGTGAEWRASLFESLLGNPENVEMILSAFAEDPDLGVVTAPGSLLGTEFWGGDYELVRELLMRIELNVDRDRLQFPAGSFYWIRGFVLQGLRSLMMTAADFDKELGQIDGTTAHAVERSIGLLSTEAGLRMKVRPELEVVDPVSWRRYRGSAPRAPRARVIPFYLPQFHATEENDAWWGKGFTEWTNVTAARPIYLGHNQPNLPSDLGFYDLRLDAVRQEQMDLASAHGIEGFMYYHYWFAGQRMLNMPIDKLAESDVNKPFCIMWANENWTRRWDGRSSDVLMGQDYDRVPATGFIDDAMHFLADPRYLRIDGKPVLAVYRIAQIPDYRSVVEHWRKRAVDAGVGDLIILSVDVAKDFDGLAGIALADGLDGTLGFPPHNHLWDWVPHGGLRVDRRFKGNILRYQSMVAAAQRTLLRLSEKSYPGVMVTFDNTPRRQWKSDVWFGANPYSFRRWLSAACSAVADREPDSRVVFVNAWNEWAEGAVLEPTRRFGRSYLHAVRDVVFG